MGKAGRWLKSILAGRKDGGGRGREKALMPQQGDATPLPSAAGSPREKKRWSFRRPHQPAGKAAPSPSPLSSSSGPHEPALSVSGRELDQSEQAVAVAVAAAAAVDAAVAAAAEAAAAVARLAKSEQEDDEDGEAAAAAALACLLEDAAAARIQATFRGYLARKALCALRGLVKLQALVRGQLVRRQATATLRRMQALVDAQSRLRDQRARMLDADPAAAAAAYQQRRSPQHPRRRSSYEMDRSGEEQVKEMDVAGEPAARRGRSSCSAAAGDSRERRLAEYYYYNGGGGQCSPAPSALFGAADLATPRARSGHYYDDDGDVGDGDDDGSALALALDAAAACTARSSPYAPPYYYCDAGGGDVPSYMANTESSRAKARSQSAPRQRTADAASVAAALERQPSRRRAAGGGGARKMMLRSSSHIGVAPAAAACGAYGYGYGAGAGYGYQQQQQNPWAGVRLDRSSASLVGSECGSTSSVLTAATVGYCRSLVGFEVHRGHY